LEPVECPHLLLVNAGRAVSTATAYAGLSRPASGPSSVLTGPQPARIMPFTLVAAKANRELPLVASNDLEETVIAAHPEIAEVKRRLKDSGARHVVMSGSGGTVFGVFDNSETSERAQVEMRGAGFWAAPARTVSRREYHDSLFE